MIQAGRCMEKHGNIGDKLHTSGASLWHPSRILSAWPSAAQLRWVDVSMHKVLRRKERWAIAIYIKGNDPEQRSILVVATFNTKALCNMT